MEQGASPDATADPSLAGDTGTAVPTDGTSLPTDGSTGDLGTTVGDAADGDLLNVNVNLDGDANIAAPIDASVAANVGSVDSDAVSVAQQTAIINQNIDGSATANSDQVSDISQP